MTGTFRQKVPIFGIENSPSVQRDKLRGKVPKRMHICNYPKTHVGPIFGRRSGNNFWEPGCGSRTKNNRCFPAESSNFRSGGPPISHALMSGSFISPSVQRDELRGRVALLSGIVVLSPSLASRKPMARALWSPGKVMDCNTSQDKNGIKAEEAGERKGHHSSRCKLFLQSVQRNDKWAKISCIFDGELSEHSTVCATDIIKRE